MPKREGAKVIRITGARTGLTEDVRQRQRRYVISMAVRTVSVILTVVLWNVERPLAWAMLVLGVLLPYVAVVYANAGRENTPVGPTTSYVPPPAYVPSPTRPALEPSSVESGAERRAEQDAGPEAAAHDSAPETEHRAEPPRQRPDDGPQPEPWEQSEAS